MLAWFSTSALCLSGCRAPQCSSLSFLTASGKYLATNSGLVHSSAGSAPPSQCIVPHRHGGHSICPWWCNPGCIAQMPLWAVRAPIRLWYKKKACAMEEIRLQPPCGVVLFLMDQVRTTIPHPIYAGMVAHRWPIEGPQVFWEWRGDYLRRRNLLSEWHDIAIFPVATACTAAYMLRHHVGLPVLRH